MSSLYLVGYFGYCCGPCVLPSRVILMMALKTKTKSQTKTNHKKALQEKQLEAKYVCEYMCFDYKLNCFNSSKMFSLAVS